MPTCSFKDRIIELNPEETSRFIRILEHPPLIPEKKIEMAELTNVEEIKKFFSEKK